MTDATGDVLLFGPFRLDRARGALSRNGTPVRLHAQPMRLLCLLAGRPGQIVSREEIQRAIWEPDTHVDYEQGINAAIKQVRTALGERAGSPRVIETLPRRGYRFIARLEPTPPAAAPATLRMRSVALIAAGLLILATTLALRWPVDRNPARVETTRPTLVVLPFVNLGPDDADDWLGDALTEELITHLGGRFPERLGVIARTSSMRYRGSDRDITEIASELDADYVVEGSIQTVDGELRVTAQLIRAGDRTHLWARTYDRPYGQLLAVQTEVSDRIATTLVGELVPAPVDSDAPAPEAVEALARARHHVGKQTPESLRAARAQLEQALTIEPDYARAHVLMARVQRWLVPPPEGSTLALQSVQRALEVDPTLAEAHLALAHLRFYADYDLVGARSAFEQALALNPDYAEAHHAFAAYHSVTGDHRQALSSVERSRRLDPVSADVNADIGWYHYFAREYEAAIAASRRTLELEPDFYWARLCIELASVQTGDLSAAASVGRQALKQDTDPRAVELVTVEDDEAFLRGLWELRRSRVRELVASRRVAPATLAQVEMQLGNRESAMALLEQSYERRAGWILPFLTVDPLFDPLRGEPRFEALVRRVAGGERLTARLEVADLGR